MILFKSALNNIRHHLLVNAVIVLQMIAAIVITIIMVSSILIRYQYYSPFKEYFQANGFYCIFADFANGDLENWNNQGSLSESERDDLLRSVDDIYLDSSELLDYFSDAESIAACHTVLTFPMGYDSDDALDCTAISYDDSIIENYTPELADGRWLNTSADAEELEIVVSENDYDWKVGDTVTLQCTQYPQAFYTTAKIVGILKEPVKVPGASARDGADTFQLFYETYSYEIEETPLMIFSSDSIEKLTGDDPTQKILQAVRGSAIITFPESYTEEELKEVQQELASVGCTVSIPLKEMNANSMAYLYAQVYNLLPIIIVLLILTIVSSISSSALSTKRRLKDYSIYYICGLRWRQCILINTIESTLLVVTSMVISYILIHILQHTSLSYYMKIIWSPVSIIALLCIIILYILMSLLMPILIIGQNTPKQILTK